MAAAAAMDNINHPAIAKTSGLMGKWSNDIRSTLGHTRGVAAKGEWNGWLRENLQQSANQKLTGQWTAQTQGGLTTVYLGRFEIKRGNITVYVNMYDAIFEIENRFFFNCSCERQRKLMPSARGCAKISAVMSSDKTILRAWIDEYLTECNTYFHEKKWLEAT